MKVPLYLLCCIFLFKWTDSETCDFQFGSYRRFRVDSCICGPENQTVSRQEGKYCCVINRDTCKNELCPNATVLYNYQPCLGICGDLRKQCPSNPNYCFDSNPKFYNRPVLVSICTRNLKYRVWKLKFDELGFLSSLN